MSFEEIFSITSRTVNTHEDADIIEFHCFDFKPLGLTPNEEPTQAERFNLLTNYFSSLKTNKIKFVRPRLAFNYSEVMTHYDMIIKEKYEGIILRHMLNTYLPRRSTYLMKFKPKKEDYYRIIGYQEEISQDGTPKNTLGSLRLISTDGTPFSCGSGFTKEQRITLWKHKENLLDKICCVKYQHLTPGKAIPRFPIFCEVLNFNESPINTGISQIK